MATTKKYSAETSAQAMQNLIDSANAEAEMKYTSAYGDRINSVMGEIEQGRNFKYDAGTDVAYQNAKKLYEQSGKKAMTDTLAKSAALTGGYSNSYGQVAGQGAYNDYMSKISSLLQDYEDRAYTRNQNEQSDRYNLLDLYTNLDATDYSRFGDDVTRAQNRTNTWNSIYGNLYNKETTDRDYNYQLKRDEISDARYADETAYNREQDALNRIAAASSSSKSSGSSSDGDTEDTKKLQSGDKSYFLDEMKSITNSVDLYNYAVKLLKQGYSDDDVESLLVQTGVRDPAVFMYTAGKNQSAGVKGMNYSYSKSSIHDGVRQTK